MLEGPLPLYFQVQEQLRRRIVSGALVPGAPLPTEAQLCSQFGVSRITVGKALDGLVADRLIRRRRGVGTFVAEPPQPAKSVRLTGWIDEMLAPVKNHSYTLLSAGTRKASPDILDRLSLKDRVFCLESLYSSEQGVFSYSKVYTAPELGKSVEDELTEDERPSIRVIERLLDTRLERAEQTVKPVRPSAKIAGHLGVAARTPVLEIMRTYFVGGGRPISVLMAWYHPERFRYTIELFPRPGQQDA